MGPANKRERESSLIHQTHTQEKLLWELSFRKTKINLGRHSQSPRKHIAITRQAGNGALHPAWSLFLALPVSATSEALRRTRRKLQATKAATTTKSTNACWRLPRREEDGEGSVCLGVKREVRMVISKLF